MKDNFHITWHLMQCMTPSLIHPLSCFLEFRSPSESCSIYIDWLFKWGEASQQGGTSTLSEILFIPHLHEKNTPPEWDIFYPSKSACLFLGGYVILIVYLFFCFYFNIKLLNNIHTAKLYKMNCIFSRNNYKNTPSLN